MPEKEKYTDRDILDALASGVILGITIILAEPYLRPYVHTAATWAKSRLAAMDLNNELTAFERN